MDDHRWRGRTSPPRTRWFALAPVLLAVVLVVAGQWLLLALPVILGVLIARTVIDVRVDDDGLRVRSLLGRPQLHVPAVEVRRAEVRVHVSPWNDFAGHGWRTSVGGTRGVVVREGEALVVDRTDDVPLVVTVDDAAGAADALNAVARQARSR